MAFDASLIIIRDRTVADVSRDVMLATNAALLKYHIRIIRDDVSLKEYTDNTSSREINKYIRVRRKVLEDQKKDAYDLIKVGCDRYTAFEQFASVKYACVSISQMGKDVIVWYSFHSKLYRAFDEFSGISYSVAELLSRGLKAETALMSATSMSRSADNFVYFYHGNVRNKIDGKNGLTEVRNVYGLDINKIIDNVEMNIAIVYAPVDFLQIKQDIVQQKERHQKFIEKMHDETITDKETHENMIQAFETENAEILEHLQYRYELTSKAFVSEPIGTMVYFKMDDISRSPIQQIQDEHSFG